MRLNTVCIVGTFDVLHFAHVKMLEYARGLGDNLIVMIDSDARVKELKGDDRPFHNVNQRKYNLEAIKYVDMVLVFSSDELLEDMLFQYAPQIRVIGEEYKTKKIIGKEFSKEIVYFPKVAGFSSTKIIEQWK